MKKDKKISFGDPFLLIFLSFNVLGNVKTAVLIFKLVNESSRSY